MGTNRADGRTVDHHRAVGAHSARRAAVGTALAVDHHPAHRSDGRAGRWEPVRRRWPFTVGLGGLLDVLRFALLTGVLLGLGGMVSWTTNVADVAPAVAVLGRPLGLVRIPVDEWAVAIALAMRAFPMLLEEFRILYAARRLRPKPPLPPTWRGRLRHWGGNVIDVLTAAITVALRRADEMGDAITARGGTGQISAMPSRPQPRDWVALSVVALVCGAALISELVLFPTTRY